MSEDTRTDVFLYIEDLYEELKELECNQNEMRQANLYAWKLNILDCLYGSKEFDQ